MDEYWQHTLDFLKFIRQHWPAHPEGTRLHRAGRAPRQADRGRSQAACDRHRPGDRGGLHRLDPGDRDAARHHREVAARRAGAARPRHRSRRRDVEHDRQPRRRDRGRAWPSAIRHVGAAARASASSAKPSRCWASRPPHGRERLASEALRPAAASELWQQRLADADFAAHADAALASVAVIEAANAEEEALAIAVALREAMDDPARPPRW